MSVPGPVIGGTVIYLILLCIGFVGIMSANKMNVLNKDNAEIGYVVIGTSVFAMWLFWLCAWMHQWHPLIAPIYEG